MPLADTLLAQQERLAETARKSTTLPDTIAGQASRLFQSASPKLTFPSLPKPTFTQPGKPTTTTTTVRAKVAQPKTNEPTGWVWPTLSTRITTRPEAGHIAFDIGAVSPGRVGDPVFSPTYATVEKVGFMEGGFGKYIQLLTPEGYHVSLAHLEAVSPGIQAGAIVQPAQEVGLMGSSGASSGAHLHFEIDAPTMGTFGGQRTRSGAIDPRQFYPLPPVSPGGGEPGALGAPLSSYDWAPGLTSQEVAAMPALPPTLPGVGLSQPWVTAGQTTTDTSASGQAQTQAKTKGAAKAGTQGAAPAVDQAGSSGISVLSTPFGDIKIPWPQSGDNPVTSLAELVKRNVVVGVGGLIALIAIAALLWRNPTVKKAAKTAVKAAAI